MNKMQITFLGTGTSHGVPEIGCDCEVCTSTNPKNTRLRTSIFVEDEHGQGLLIDASADFRQQMLRAKIRKLTDILITHEHADHIFGLDDTRIFSRRQETPINLYLDEKCDQRIRQIYEYVYIEGIQEGGGLPKFNNILVTPGNTFSIGHFTITPVEIFHGKLQILGYRINSFAYLTDCSYIPDQSYAYLQDLDVLILDALREKPHPTHFSLEEAVQEATKIDAKRTYFTHMTHRLEHEATNAALPSSMQLAHDGLEIMIEEETV
jgi:phosphoribosyl 1,2-cyclic phosphate phosphodiesterase